MAITVSQLISDVQLLLDDDSVPTYAQHIRLVNRARRKLAERCECLKDEVSFSSTTTGLEFSLPNDCLKIEDVRFRNVDTETKPEWVSKEEYNDLDLTENGTEFTRYTEENRKIKFSPMMTSAADTTSVSTALTAVATTVEAVDVDSFPTMGKIIIGSEVISYTDKVSSGTYIAFLNCTRGEEGTTTTAHALDAVITERDVVVQYIKIPTDSLTSSGSLEEAFSFFADCFVYWMAWQAKIKDTDDTQSTGADRQSLMFRQMFEEEVEKLMAYQFPRDGIMTIREVE